MGSLAFVDFVFGGALWGYARTNWRYALFFLYLYLLPLMMVLTSSYAGDLIARESGSSAKNQDARDTLPPKERARQPHSALDEFDKMYRPI